MRAARLTGPGRFTIEEVKIPEPGPGQVRIQVESCGVCASNVPPWEGRPWFRYPFAPGALGHEACGDIDALGPNVTGLCLGQRVAALSSHAYAEFDLAEADAVLPIPDTLENVPFPGEPLGCALNIIQRSGIKPGDTVAIVGVGFLGALLLELALPIAERVFAIARRPFAQKLAASLGATRVFAVENATVERIGELTEGKFCDVVFEATGKEQPLALAGELTRERGRLVIAGYHQDGWRQINLELWNWRGLDVINAHERDPLHAMAGIRAALGAVEEGRLSPQRLLTHCFALEDLHEALRLTRERPEGFLKALVLP